MPRLKRSFYLRPTARVARELLGKILCVRTENGIERSRIVETEAYLGVEDRACHSFGGRRTERTEVMYRAGGHLYVYFIYGMHFCINVVAGEKDVPEAVLIRAVEPLGGTPAERLPRSKMRTNGPGKLAAFYGITRADNGLDLAGKGTRIWLEDAPRPRERVRATPRIGIDGSGEAKHELLRYSLEGNPFVSGKKI